YTLEGLEKIKLDYPVAHISFFEADAFAQWKGQRLLTEFEWEVACNRLAPKIPAQANLLEKDLLSPPKQTMHDFQFYVDCWERSMNACRPLHHFRASKGALGD